MRAVTYIAEVQDIVPYKDTGKFEVIFKGPAKKIGPIPIENGRYSPQGPVYVERDKLLEDKYLENALDIDN